MTFGIQVTNDTSDALLSDTGSYFYFKEVINVTTVSGTYASYNSITYNHASGEILLAAHGFNQFCVAAITLISATSSKIEVWTYGSGAKTVPVYIFSVRNPIAAASYGLAVYDSAGQLKINSNDPPMCIGAKVQLYPTLTLQQYNFANPHNRTPLVIWEQSLSWSAYYAPENKNRYYNGWTRVVSPTRIECQGFWTGAWVGTVRDDRYIIDTNVIFL